MIDSTLLGETAAKCMGYLDDTVGLDGGTVLSVGIVVVAQNEAGDQTFTRTFCSDLVHYHQVGLFSEASKVVSEGYSPNDRGGDPDDDDED